MKPVFLLSALLLLAGAPIKSQDLVRGSVSDAFSGNPIAAASIRTSQGTEIKTDRNGSFQLTLPAGRHVLFVEAGQSYKKDSVVVTTPVSQQFRLDIVLEPSSRDLDAVRIVANIADRRKTPIAFSNLNSRKLNEMIGSQDMPMVLNYTPGVYATQQGGGAGDARITIRGFNQRNIAVMIDGIPVNDMENGQVYWSNWFGLADVTELTQVQRGLGSSRIANPSVGGTMNVITKGISSEAGGRVTLETGDSRYRRSSFSYNSGRLPGDWGFTLAGTYRESDGYVNGLYDRMYSYFFKTEKDFGAHHNISLTAIGAPQSHGQRSFRARLSVYDTEFAQRLGVDSVIANTARNQGIRYNQHYGYLNRATVNGPGDTTFAVREGLNERENMFHKPQFYLKHTYKKKRLLISSTAYASYGRGGGTSSRGVAQVPFVNGLYNFQDAYYQNRYGSAFVSAVDPVYHPTESKSRAIISRAVNNHNWFGLLSTFQYRLPKNMTISGGVDFRTYKGIHYREVYDLLGGDYYRPDGRDTFPFAPSRLYRKGDKFAYYNEGYVRWGGTFAEWEYTGSKFSAFINASVTRSLYQRADYFRPVNGGPEYTGWTGFTGYTLKGGYGRSLGRRHRVFANVGRLERPQRFNNVFDNRNRIARDIKNETVNAIEGGYTYRSRYFSTDINVYYTQWLNKPVDNLPSYVDQDGNIFSYNINGIQALHRGIEWSFAYKPVSWFSWEVAATLADWIWNSGARAEVRDDNGNVVAIVDFSAKGVHVGDAAQQQFSSMLRFEPVKGAYITPSVIWFGKQFADFDPSALVGPFKDREAWRIPDYATFNLAYGYTRRFGEYSLGLFGNVFNILNTIYISDAQHRNQGSPAATLNPKNVEVYVGPGTRWTLGLRFGF
jgi:iron complex outermembrane receptor protein